jgi:hypothetical protein
MRGSHRGAIGVFVIALLWATGVSAGTTSAPARPSPAEPIAQLLNYLWTRLGGSVARRAGSANRLDGCEHLKALGRARLLATEDLSPAARFNRRVVVPGWCDLAEDHLIETRLERQRQRQQDRR